MFLQLDYRLNYRLYRPSIKLQKEFETKGDIIVGNFHDTYYNLLYKARTALDFFDTSCRAKALILMDDDIVIRHPAIFNNNISKSTFDFRFFKGSVLRGDMIVCLNYAFIDKDVLRWGKWKVTAAQYNVRKYPNFCNGAGIAFTRQAAKKILMKSAETKPFHLDDVYISGILRRKANVPLFAES